MKKTVVCTVCPSGCEIEAVYTGEDDFAVSGNRCKRGETYCRNECFDPRRTFTASVKIEGSSRAMLPVRSTEAVPRDSLMRCAEEVHKTTLKAPIRMRETVIKNVAGTGIDVIASMSIERDRAKSEAGGAKK